MKQLLIALLMVAGCGAPVGSAGGGSLTPTAAPGVTDAPIPPGATTPAPDQGTDEAKDILVLESGFTYFPGETPYAQFGAVLENPNPTGWVASVDITIAFYDGRGDVLTTVDESVYEALPGKFAIGGVAFDVKGVKSMEIDFTTEWESVDFELGSYKASKVKLTHDRYESRVTGVVTCTFKDDRDDVQTVAIFRDANGRVIGGDIDYINKVRCEKGSPFSISTLARMTKAKTVDVYPS